MDIRQLARGSIEWERLERVVHTLADRYDRELLRVEFLEADNWLSTPCVVEDEWFLKIISRQNAIVHGVLTTGRNLGAFTSGGEVFFERFQSPLEMAEHEFEATRRMREIGLNAPMPIEVFEANGLGVVVLEYLPEFETLEELDPDRLEVHAPELFAMLRRLHEHNMAHGDVRAENVLLSRGELYFIDATNVNEAALDSARSYDLASALAVLEPRIGASAAVTAAAREYDAPDLLAAREFLDFVSFRPDHDFDAAQLKGELEKVVEIQRRERTPGSDED